MHLCRFKLLALLSNSSGSHSIRPYTVLHVLFVLQIPSDINNNLTSIKCTVNRSRYVKYPRNQSIP